MITNATNFLKTLNKPDPLFVDILLKRAELTGDNDAFTFVSNNGDIKFTYQQIDSKIKQLASFLQQSGLKGERALLLYPPGFDYIIGYFACLYAGVIAVPVYPPDPTRMEKTLPRLEAIAKDADAKIALSTNEIRNQIVEWRENLKINHVEMIENTSTSEFLSRMKDILDIKWLATDNFESGDASLWKYPNISSNDIAYLQYTSGSTGTPKGVMITHQNLVHNTHVIYEGFDLNRGEFEGVIWLPIYHDMGLVGGILEPIFAGFHCTLLSPIDFLKRPQKWLQLINDRQGKNIVSGGPNFAYDLCVRGTNEQKRKELNLSNWKLAFTGAEPVRAETIDEFVKAFEVSGFDKRAMTPCYGLAEGTLMASVCDVKNGAISIDFEKEELLKNNAVKTEKSENSVTLVSSGSSVLEGKIKVVNPDTKSICMEGQIGEIWSMSTSNAIGYWNRPELSNETFNAYIAGLDEGPYLRTGDLGFILNNELFITGRLKDLIIIRGSNHYPQDIELTAENSNNLLRPGSVAAFSIDAENEEKLVIVIEARAKKNVDWGNVVEDIKESILQAHNINAYAIVLIQPKTIFKTSSGKIKRRATKEAYLNGSLEIIFEGNQDKSNKKIVSDEPTEAEPVKMIKNNGSSKSHIEKLLIERLAEELKISQSEIKTNQPFASYGLDSAKTVQLVGILEEEVGKNLDVTILWSYPTIEKLADYLAKETMVDERKIADVEEKKESDDFADSVKDLTEEEAEELLLKKLGIK